MIERMIVVIIGSSNENVAARCGAQFIFGIIEHRVKRLRHDRFDTITAYSRYSAKKINSYVNFEVHGEARGAVRLVEMNSRSRTAEHALVGS